MRGFCSKRLVVLFFVCFQVVPLSVSAAELTLALADSTCDTMHRLGVFFAQESGVTLNYVCKSSGLLAKGIEAGVIKADYFLSANRKWMDSVVGSGLIDPQEIQSTLGNQLVIASSRRDSSIQIGEMKDLQSPHIQQILIGDPGTAPFGRYAKEAMIKADIWDSVRDKIVSRKKISLAIQLLHENTQQGMVSFLYKTNIDESLRIDLVIPEQMHTPILYYAAPLQSASSSDAMKRFLSFLSSKKASDIFRAAGFSVLGGN